ncbi:hypothetical protein ABZP36_030097 [Zizania latifolia]
MYRPWEELQIDHLMYIARSLPCLADRVNMSRVCSSWREAVATLPLQPELPCLILPWRGDLQHLHPYGSRTPSLFCVLGRHSHHLRLPPARCFGSYDGGWIFLANHQTHGHDLINLYSDRRITIPNTVQLATREEDIISITILVATLSSTPPPLIGPIAPYDLQCLGAAIIYTGSDDPAIFDDWMPHIIVWLVGKTDHEILAYMEPCEDLQVVDVIYYQSAFHFLSQWDDIFVVTPQLHHYSEPGQQVVAQDFRIFARWEVGDEHDDHAFDARYTYLVESREELLMVERCAISPGSQTMSFRVFQMLRLPEPVGLNEYAWIRLPALGGRVLFVGRGCSRSYEVADFPGLEDGVYFLDDRDSVDVNMMGYSRWYRRFDCNNNGEWLEQEQPSRINSRTATVVDPNPETESSTWRFFFEETFHLEISGLQSN